MQEEETALKAARSISRQQTPSSSPEASDSEESDSTSESETEGLDSEQGELTGSKSETVDPSRGPSLRQAVPCLLMTVGCAETQPSGHLVVVRASHLPPPVLLEGPGR